MIKDLYKRFIFENFLRPSRLKEYERMIIALKNAGYEFMPISSFYELSKKNKVDSSKKYCIIRHDIDTDPNTAHKFFMIEKAHDIRSTYYYRWFTFDKARMTEMMSFGTEVGYHFEELATISKSHKLKGPDEVESHLQEIKELFIKNYKLFQSKVGTIHSCAAHGDWINAKYLKINNNILLDDEIRSSLCILLEAYDNEFTRLLSSDIADLGRGDTMWIAISGRSNNINEAIQNKEPVLEILVHPRQWYSSWYWNMHSDLLRLIETIRYRLL